MTDDSNAPTPDAHSDNKATHRVALSIGSSLLSQVHPSFNAASQWVDIEAGSTVADVLEQVGFPKNATLLVVLNDTLVNAASVPTQLVASDDKLSLMAPIHAG